MISYFKYDNGNAFTLDGVDYAGYFHVINETAYSGKPQDKNSQQLTSKNTYLSELYLNRAKFDGRQIDLDLKLPNAFDILDETTLSRYFDKISTNNSIIYNSNIFINPLMGSFDYGSSVFYTLTSTPIDTRLPDDQIYGRAVYTHSDPFSGSPTWAFLDNIKSGYITLINENTGFMYFCEDGSTQYTLSGSFTAGSLLTLLTAEPALSTAASIIDYGNNELFELTANSISIYDISNEGVCNTKILRDSINAIIDLNYKNLYKIGKDRRTEFKNNTLYIKNKYSNEIYSEYPLGALDLTELVALDIRKEDDNIIAIGKKDDQFIFLYFDITDFSNTFAKTKLDGILKVTNIAFSTEDSDIFELWQQGYDGSFYSQYRAIDRADIVISETASILSTNYFYIKDYKFSETNEKFDKIQIKFNSNAMKSNSYNAIVRNMFQQDGYFYDITHNVGRLYATKSTQPFFVFTIPSNLKKIYNGIECSDSGAGISFNASLINLIKDTINLATLSQKTKGQSSDASEILSLAEPIQRLTIDMENLRLNGNETFSELVLRRIFSNIYAIQSKIYKYSILVPERPVAFIPTISNPPIEINEPVQLAELPSITTTPISGTSVYDSDCLPDELYFSFGTGLRELEFKDFYSVPDGTFIAKFDGNGYAVYSGNGMWINRYDMFGGTPVEIRVEYINNRWVIKLNGDLWMSSYYIEGQQNGIDKCNPYCTFATLADIENTTASYRNGVQTTTTDNPVPSLLLNVQPVVTVPEIGPTSVKVALKLNNSTPVKICAQYYDHYSGYLLYTKDKKGVDPATATGILEYPTSFLVLRFLEDSWVVEENLDILATAPTAFYSNGKLSVGKVSADRIDESQVDQVRLNLASSQGFGAGVAAGSPGPVRDRLQALANAAAKREAIAEAEAIAKTTWLPDKSKKFNRYNNQTTPYNLQFIKGNPNLFTISTFEADDECLELPNVLI
jgi:hypothetical protein